MIENRDENTNCPECDGLDRRDFVRVVGGTAVTLVGLQAIPAVARAAQPAATPAPARAPRPAEALIRELFSGLNDEQKRKAVYPWDHREGNTQIPVRLGMFNAPLNNNRRIADIYTPAQRELVQRILRSISSDEEGYSKMTRNGTFDGSQSLQGCGAYIFGDPSANNQQWAWVFMGHHLTVRCDGNSVADVAFGGPIYYGHSPDGYSQRNCFYYQTQAVKSVFDALNENQRRQAVVDGTPGEHEPSVRFRPRTAPRPGIPASELTADQKNLVRTVMREVLSPYRREDADEVMEIVGRNGGLERIHLAFYRDAGATGNDRWHFWRLEGPGFVWNYRVLPHVHTYVNIAVQA
jgi:hypothetical protein